MGIMTILGFIWRFLTSKLGVVMIILTLIGVLEWRVYDWGKDSVRAEAAKQVAKAQLDAKTKVNAIKAKYDKLVTDTNTWKAQVAKAEQTASEVNQAVVVDLQNKLNAAKAQSTKLKSQLQEIQTYVTPKADSECTITTGFVSVYNAAIKASPLPDSAAGNVDAPTGITISRLATIDAANLAECAERGRIIDAWQDWYTRNKTAYDAATEIAR